MEKYYTESDAGAVMFGNKDFVVLISNKYGDCQNKVLVFEDFDELDRYCQKEYKAQSCDDCFDGNTLIRGKFNLYNYDCCDPNDSYAVVRSFEGRYYVLVRCPGNHPTIAVVKVK